MVKICYGQLALVIGTGTEYLGSMVVELSYFVL